LLHFGGEGTPYPGSSLKVTGNTLQNYRSPAVGLLNHTAITASVTGNKLYQLPNLVSGPSTQANNTTLSSPVAVSTKSPWWAR
jgi:hypothetical protein